MFRWGVPRLQGRFSTLRLTLVAVLIMGVVGTLANDGGIGVWQPATAYATTVVGCLWAASLRARAGAPTGGPVAAGTVARTNARRGSTNSAPPLRKGPRKA